MYKQIAQICRIPPLTESVKRFHWFRLHSFSFQRFFVDLLIRIVCILSLLGLWAHTDRSEVGITTRIWGNEVYKQHSHVIEFYQRWIVGWILSRLQHYSPAPLVLPRCYGVNWPDSSPLTWRDDLAFGAAFLSFSLEVQLYMNSFFLTRQRNPKETHLAVFSGISFWITALMGLRILLISILSLP